MKYNKFEVDKVKSEADIRRLIPGANERLTTQDIDCPFCGKKKKFRISHKKGFNNARCFACQEGFSNPIAAYAYYNNLDIEKDFLKCLEGTAQECGVIITPEETRRKESVQKTTAAYKQTFCSQQLEASGLTVEDVFANVIENNQELIKSPFQPGSVRPGFLPDTKGDDMLIFYYDLYGRPIQYTVKGSKTLRHYFRVRFANPDLHEAQDGTKMKYQSPPGVPTQVLIPEKIRRLYKSKAQINTLFLQEGEKKAEKACKHGMLSLGLQGIMNIGNKEHGLIQAIQDIVKTCQVRHVVLIMDSDWNDLSKNITTGDRADKRPVSFAAAVIKFKQYVETFHNLGLNVDIWWGHVNQNENGDKGVDDLLVGSLKGREHELMEDIDRTMHSHDGHGKWLDIHKITAISDAKIRDFWQLNDRQAFFALHRQRLAEIPTFKLGGVRYKVENGMMIPVSRYSSDVEIFSIETDSKDKQKVVLNYTETFRFLSASGFYRLRNSEEAASGYDYIRIDGGIIDRTAPYELRDFILQYIMTNIKIPLVQEFFNSKLDVLLPDKKLERLEMRTDNYNNFEPDVQRTYYNNGQVEITSQSIIPGQPIANVWRNRIVPRDFRRVEVIKSITKVGDIFDWELTPDGEKCEFLRYLINTSNNYYTHDAPRETTNEENIEWIQHIVNKITTIGFLLTDWKYPSDRQAVVVQDHRISEVGQAWGGAGKSVLGTALGKILAQFFINGQDFSANDEFILSGVTKATRNIFIDDVRPNFDFKNIFNWITGPMPVNPKQEKRFTIPVEDSPKILLTTNHAIKSAEEGSVKRRIAYMEFSSWYNQDHSLIDDFHHMFFDDWDEYQWTLFDNLMAECVMYYLRSFEQIWHREGRGAVPPPMKNIELRTLRQAMSEVFLQWAEEYFDPTGEHLNQRITRKELWATFLEFAGGMQGHGVTRSNFKMKMIAYCRYKGYDFNYNKPIDNKTDTKVFYSDWKPSHPNESFIGDEDKSGGSEYFTVYSEEKYKADHPI
ncbi:MAG: hypothetical protein HDS60_03620 [Barnesiella sp.]|nr:hypothetical protein [Barnesiella sp.]